MEDDWGRCAKGMEKYGLKPDTKYTDIEYCCVNKAVIGLCFQETLHISDRADYICTLYDYIMPNALSSPLEFNAHCSRISRKASVFDTSLC
jgi:hypothetical protein